MQIWHVSSKLAQLTGLEVLDLRDVLSYDENIPETIHLPSCMTEMGALSRLALTARVMPPVVVHLPRLRHLTVTGLPYKSMAYTAAAALDHVPRMLLQGTRMRYDGWPGPLQTFFSRPSSDPAPALEAAPAPFRCGQGHSGRAPAAAAALPAASGLSEPQPLQQPERAESLGSVQAVIIAGYRAGRCPAGHCTLQKLNA